MPGNLFDLTGTVALITGGNSGIGLGFAEGLATHGADIAIWGTNASKNDAAVEQLRRHGTSVASFVCDVGDPEAVTATFEATVGAMGKVDSCFANAGVSGKGIAFTEMSPEEWHRVLRVNLDGAMYTSQAAVRHWVEAGNGGSLVVTTSGSAFEGQQRGQHYGASKAGVIALMRAIAVEYAKHGVRANAVLPGWVTSDLTASVFAWDRFVENVKPRVPLGRWGEPDDLSGIAVYLASDASRWHTGDIISIDGGYSIF